MISPPRAEHPFAPYVRILGKGKTGTRSLDRAEAREAMGMILRGEVEAVQLGAFLMLLRVKEESPEEIAGFVEACRDNARLPATRLEIDLDWSSYAGKKHQHPWFLLSLLLLAQDGYRILVHGTTGHTPGRLYTEQAMRQLGLPVASDWQSVATGLDEANLCYLSLEHFCPALQDIMLLKPLLGLRSPVNTLARLINPLRAPASIQSIFHPAYAHIHRQADRLLGQPASLVFKGESGEVEIKPHADTCLYLLTSQEQREQDMPRTLRERPPAVEQCQVEPLRALWRGESPDAYGEAAALGTAASALWVLDPARDLEMALERAAALWSSRDRSRLG